MIGFFNAWISIETSFEANCFNSDSETEPFSKILEIREASSSPGHSSQHSGFSLR